VNYLITGGSGFIGVPLTSELLRQSARVTVIDDLKDGHSSSLPKHPLLTFIRKDVMEWNPQHCTEPFDAVIHLAASPSVASSWTQPQLSHTNNLSTTVRIIQLCLKTQIKRIVFASSAAVYGHAPEHPIREDAPILPVSPYGLQKAASEHYGKLFATANEITFIALRLFNVYGSLTDPSSANSGVVNTFMHAAKNGSPLPVHGNGSATRDFISIKDVVTAFCKAITYSDAKMGFTAINVATGASMKISDLAQATISLCPERRAEVIHSPEPVGSIHFSCGDVSKANNLLGFTSSRSLAEDLPGLFRAAPII